MSFALLRSVSIKAARKDAREMDLRSHPLFLKDGLSYNAKKSKQEKDSLFLSSNIVRQKQILINTKKKKKTGSQTRDEADIFYNKKALIYFKKCPNLTNYRQPSLFAGVASEEYSGCTKTANNKEAQFGAFWTL